jgi:TldD protein
MIDKLKPMISSIAADYVDVRYEIKKETKILYSGKDLTFIGSNTTDGYVVRVLKNGGLSSVAFTRDSDAMKALKTAEENARIISKYVAQPVRLAPADTIIDTFLPYLDEDPRNVSIDEKMELVRSYNDIPFNHKLIATTDIGYTEINREKYFVNTDGTAIREDLVTTRINGNIVSKDGTLIQNVRVGIGGSNGFAVLRNREGEFDRKTSIAVELLKAKPVRGGMYSVILNQSMAGLFTHEAFGHFSEADIIEDNISMRRKMALRSRLGNNRLTIIDDPTRSGQLGYYKYDDEGVRAQPTYLLTNGVLTGRLHSRRTAAAFDEQLNGHCVAEDHRYAPIIRMGTIFIQPQDRTFDNLLNELGDGLYILDSKGGQTSGENFTFGAQYGYAVKNGKVGSMLREINLTGNLYTTMMNIRAIGNDLLLSETGGCGKGQMNYRSCYGAPHVLIDRVVIGGT